MHDSPTHLDLFSGIGGFSLAAERCGFQTVAFSEIDSYASAVLKKHWPNVPNFGDIRNIGKMRQGFFGENEVKVDLITAGFPCQPFSNAGQRRGDSDERFLWPEIVRVLGEVRPAFALFENVPGLLTIDGGRTFNRILSDLVSFGYDCLWNLVSASAVGANHQRDRLWLIAHAQHHAGRSKFGIESWKRKDEPASQNSVLGESCNDLANAMREQDQWENKGGFQFESSGGSENVAHSNRPRKSQQARLKPECGNRVIHSGENVSNSNGERRRSLQGTECTADGSTQRDGGWWGIEPDVGRVAHGIPKRVDRLRCLGNSIVPQVAEIFLREIRKLICS